MLQIGLNIILFFLFLKFCCTQSSVILAWIWIRLFIIYENFFKFKFYIFLFWHCWWLCSKTYFLLIETNWIKFKMRYKFIGDLKWLFFGLRISICHFCIFEELVDISMGSLSAVYRPVATTETIFRGCWSWISYHTAVRSVIIDNGLLGTLWDMTPWPLTSDVTNRWGGKEQVSLCKLSIIAWSQPY